MPEQVLALVAVVPVLLALLLLLLQVVAVRAHLPDLEHLLALSRWPVLRPVLAQLQAVAALAHLAVVVPVEVAPQLTRSCSVAMAGISRSPGPPM